jgi:hypothetical protein
MKTSKSPVVTVSAALVALGWSFPAVAGSERGRAPQKAFVAIDPAESIDDHVEFIRVATGHYDEKRPSVPLPVPRPPAEVEIVDERTEFIRVATGRYDPPKPSPKKALPMAAIGPKRAVRPVTAAGEAGVPVPSYEAGAGPAVPAPTRPATMSLDIGNPYKELIDRYAAHHGLPPALAHAVVTIESRYDPMAFNAGAIGLMQILLPTARGLGYDGDRNGLHDPEINVRYGILYLAQAYRLSNGDTCQTVMRYQSGHFAKAPNAANIAYCERALSLMARSG